MDREIFFDTETLPTLDMKKKAAIQAPILAKAEAEVEAITAPGNLKDPVKIEAWLRDERPAKVAKIQGEAVLAADTAWRKTGLNGAVGELCCASWAVADDTPRGVVRGADEPERDYLERFFAEYEKDVLSSGKASREGQVFIGHNIIGFDFRFLWQRAAVHGLCGALGGLGFPQVSRLSPYHMTSVIDTQVLWSGTRGFVKLDVLIEALGGTRKGQEFGSDADAESEDMDGGKVIDFWVAGRQKDILTYCNADVLRLQEIYPKIRYM